MNIVLLRGSDWIAAGIAVVRDRRAGHIREVPKGQVGERLLVGLLGGLCGQGLIEAVDASGVRLRVELNEAPPARHPFDIVLALPRPKMLRRILRQCAEFGVSQLHLIHSVRVEKSHWQSPLLQPLRGGSAAGPVRGPALLDYRQGRAHLPGGCSGRSRGGDGRPGAGPTTTPCRLRGIGCNREGEQRLPVPKEDLAEFRRCRVASSCNNPPRYSSTLSHRAGRCWASPRNKPENCSAA